MNYKELADIIFPNVKDISYYEEKYKERNVAEESIVTRFAPSPTGYVHIGGLYQCVVENLLIQKTNGILYLRIEDTDQKREIENGVEGIIQSLKKFDIHYDEGMTSKEEEKGDYGPYQQSKRGEIYQAYAKYLLAQGKAYPCFASQQELEELRKKQEIAKIRPGYYGVWAKYRNLSVAEAFEKIQNGEDYVIRFKSPGREDRKIKHKDIIKGNIEFPENDLDIVIIKSDGLPTYHFAHVIDDHLMRTTHVIRCDEWVSSIPIHLQLFYELGFKAPKYAHYAPIMKDENGKKRKISKRKDPEAAVEFYHKEGIPTQAVKEYLLNIANSAFEGWRKSNPDKDINEFDFQLNKMNKSGALFDMTKLLNISKNLISKYSTEEIYNKTLRWSQEFDAELAEMLLSDVEYSYKVLGIERENVKPRKDISKWSEVKENIIYMYDNKFDETTDFEYGKINESKEIEKIIELYRENYFDINDDKQTWFEKIKDMTEQLGYARNVQDYKANPEIWKGHVGDISTVLRVRLTGRQNTPDLYEIMQVLGKDRVLKRLKRN